MIISICLSVIFIYIHKFIDFSKKLLRVMLWKMYFYFKKRLLYFFLWFWPREKLLIIKVISRARDSFEINSSSFFANYFWWIERKCIKNLVKEKAAGEFSEVFKVKCFMYIVFNAYHWDCYDNFFLQIFKKCFAKFHTLYSVFNATGSLYNMNFYFLNFFFKQPFLRLSPE